MRANWLLRCLLVTVKVMCLTHKRAITVSVSMYRPAVSSLCICAMAHMLLDFCLEPSCPMLMPWEKGSKFLHAYEAQNCFRGSLGKIRTIMSELFSHVWFFEQDSFYLWWIDQNACAHSRQKLHLVGKYTLP